MKTEYIVTMVLSIPVLCSFAGYVRFLWLNRRK